MDIVLLLAGTNNISPKLGAVHSVTTITAFRKQYSTLLDTVRVKFPNALVIVHDIFPRFDTCRWQYMLSHNDMAARTLRFNQVLQDLCTDRDKVCFASSHSESLADIRRYIAKDGLHLAKEGKRLLQHNTVQVCRSYFGPVCDTNNFYPYCPECTLSSSVCTHPYHVLSNVPLKEHTVEEFTSSMNFIDLNKREAHYYGEHPYPYGSVSHDANPLWHNPLIQSIADEIRGILPNLNFNSVLVNFYENGLKSIPFHSDNEAEIVEGSTIISISYGADRRFEFKTLQRFGNKQCWITLTPGNIVLMSRASQNVWKHSVPRDPQVTEPRVNLTFRLIKPAGVLPAAVIPDVLSPSTPSVPLEVPEDLVSDVTVESVPAECVCPDSINAETVLELDVPTVPTLSNVCSVPVQPTLTPALTKISVNTATLSTTSYTLTHCNIPLSTELPSTVSAEDIVPCVGVCNDTPVGVASTVDNIVVQVECPVGVTEDTVPLLRVETVRIEPEQALSEASVEQLLMVSRSGLIRPRLLKVVNPTSSGSTVVSMLPKHCSPPKFKHTCQYTYSFKNELQRNQLKVSCNSSHRGLPLRGGGSAEQGRSQSLPLTQKVPCQTDSKFNMREAELLEKRNAEKLRKKLRRENMTTEQKEVHLAERKKVDKLRRDKMDADEKEVHLAERKKVEKLRRDNMPADQKAALQIRKKEEQRRFRKNFLRVSKSANLPAFPTVFTSSPDINSPPSSILSSIDTNCSISSGDASLPPFFPDSSCTYTPDHSYLADISESILIPNELPVKSPSNDYVNQFLTTALVPLPSPVLYTSLTTFTYNCPCGMYRSNCELELSAHSEVCPHFDLLDKGQSKMHCNKNNGVPLTSDQHEAKKAKQREASKRYREKKKKEKLQSESVNEKLKNKNSINNAPPPLIAASAVVLPGMSDLPPADVVSGIGPTSNLLPVPNFVSPILALPQSTQDKLISDFHKESSQYPEFPCDTCKRTCFWHDVHLVSSTDTVIETEASSVAPPPKYMCKRCKSYLKKDAMCPLDEKNNLKVGHMPPHLNLNHTEARLCSQRYIFCKIFNLPPGGQLSVQGKCTNVPVDPSEVCLQLPRKLDESGLIPVHLKRKIEYKTIILSDSVSPDKVVESLKFLKKHNPYYKDVVLNQDWIRGNYTSNPDFFKRYMEDDAYVIALSIVHTCLVNAMGGGELTYESCLQEISPGVDEKVPTVMNYAPGQGKPARPFFNDPGNEVLAFPALFPLGSGNFSDTRDVRLTWKDYAEARLYNSDRRWAKNPEYIFWLQHNVEAEQVRSSISTFMRKGLKSSSKGQFVNAGLLKKHFQGDEDVISKIPTYKFMENIRGSPAYWRKVRSEWIATVDQQGMHTFFLTFSFNDLMYSIPAIVKLNNPGGFQNDADLLQYCQDLTWVRKHEILKDDPIIAVRMYSRYILNVIGKLLKKGMLGPYESHLGRNEFAQRGSPHSHLMVKTKDAPTQADNNGLSEGPYTAFLDQFISTKYVSAEEDPSFNQLLKVQSHSHTSTCTRPGKDCRFNYPKPVSATTQILPNNDDERVQTRRFKVVYKRNPGDEMINTYNPGLLKAVRSNMDIQAIVGYFDVIYYIISYATKNEKAQTKALRELGKNLGNLENTKSREALRELGNCYQMTRDISIQESVNRTLSHLPMKFSDPGTVWVDVNPPEKQHGMLKAQSVLEGMPDKDTNVWVPGLCQKYSARPDSMLDVCYADFAAYYISYSGPPPKSDVMDCVEDDDTEAPAAGRPSLPVITLKNKLGRMKKRGKQIVIRYYTPPIKSKPEEYYHSKICLFYPWVDHADIKGKFNTYKESFVDKESIIKPNWKRYQHLEDDDFQKLLDDCNTLFEDFMEEEQAKPALSKDFLHTHPVAGMKDPDDQKIFEFEYADPPITDTEYNRIVSSLNEKQRDIFDQIDDHSTRESQGLKNTQLIHFISGAGGCGKSFLIKALRHCINRKFSDGLRCIVTALTGSASVTVDGMTIHTACALDTQHGFMWISDFKRIQAQKLANMKKAIFNKVLYLIIDEVSMMGASLLALLNARLNELKSIEARDGTVYGGINVIFCGDFYQLPPVSAGVVYDPKANFGDHNLGPHLWKDYVTFTELTEVIRSKGDSAFTALCHRVRTGAQTEEDKETLRSRVVGYQPVRDMMDSMLICYTTKEVNEHNKLCIDYMKLTTVVHTITAIDSFKSPELNCTVSLQKLITDNPSQTAGLPSTLEITEGANVMIRVNVTTLDRIVNGVTGVVRYIDFKAPSAIPHVYVEFHDKLAGTKTGLKHETCSIFCQKPCPKLGFVKIVPVEK